MTRFSFPVMVGLALAAASTPSNATVIVQTDTEATQAGFAGFNQNLGTLNSVTLDVLISQQYRDWRLLVPPNTGDTRNVQWSIDAFYLLYGFTSGNANFSMPFTPIRMTGSGSTTVDLVPNTFLGQSEGTFTTWAGGSASFSLNPADFLFDILLGEPRIIVTGDDPGLYNAGGDTTFTVAGAHELIQWSGLCNGSRGDDFCGSAFYTLTYDYTPVGEVAAVPEPATWLTLLIGFGMVGSLLRRRLRTRKSSHAHA